MLFWDPNSYRGYEIVGEWTPQYQDVLPQSHTPVPFRSRDGARTGMGGLVPQYAVPVKVTFECSNCGFEVKLYDKDMTYTCPICDLLLCRTAPVPVSGTSPGTGAQQEWDWTPVRWMYSEERGWAPVPGSGTGVEG